MEPIQKLLIANRGEIACRIIRTCAEMDITSIAVFSDADREALHVKLADQSVHIGPPPVTKSYLDIDGILAAADQSGADAIHPGYGLLAENAEFAHAVEAAGLVWVGPDPATIVEMGDKERAREIARKLNIPILQGSERINIGDIVDLENMAHTVGLPLLVKAAAGGGGIGMRVVTQVSDLAGQIETTQKLAERTFKDGAVFVERYVPHARHVEVQVFGFGNGAGVHIFDRDCTIQRRFQKVIEEAPAPQLPQSVRKNMCDAALMLVEHQKYLGAGTVEFIYDCDREEFYFLEMNTRIQVEHTVSEMITGLDLVRWQIEASTGALQEIIQQDIDYHGHAIECRLYAERPEKNFMPSPGTLSLLRFPPESDDVRIDTGVTQGDKITPYYDPMIAKIITYGVDRDAALSRMRAALDETCVEGVGSNLEFLKQILDTSEFKQMKITTRYIENEF